MQNFLFIWILLFSFCVSPHHSQSSIVVPGHFLEIPPYASRNFSAGPCPCFFSAIIESPTEELTAWIFEASQYERYERGSPANATQLRFSHGATHLMLAEKQLIPAEGQDIVLLVRNQLRWAVRAFVVVEIHTSAALEAELTDAKFFVSDPQCCWQGLIAFAVTVSVANSSSMRPELQAIVTDENLSPMFSVGKVIPGQVSSANVSVATGRPARFALVSTQKSPVFLRIFLVILRQIAPSVTGIFPASLPTVGGYADVTGFGFEGDTYLLFHGNNMHVTCSKRSTLALRCLFPPGAGAQNAFSVQSSGKVSQAHVLRYEPPMISAVSAAQKAGGTITIAGNNFGTLPQHVTAFVTIRSSTGSGLVPVTCSDIRITIPHMQFSCLLPPCSKNLGGSVGPDTLPKRSTRGDDLVDESLRHEKADQVPAKDELLYQKVADQTPANAELLHQKLTDRTPAKDSKRGFREAEDGLDGLWDVTVVVAGQDSGSTGLNRLYFLDGALFWSLEGDVTPPLHPTAYVFFIYGDEYLDAALVAVHSVRASSRAPHDYVAMVSRDRRVDQSQLALLRSLGMRVVYVDTVLNPMAEAHWDVPFSYSRGEGAMKVRWIHFLHQFMVKIHAWSLTEYKRVICLDTDIVVLSSIEYVFDIPEFVTLPYDGPAANIPVPANHGVPRVNTAIMGLTPGADTYQDLLHQLDEFPTVRDAARNSQGQGSETWFDHFWWVTEQGLFNYYFRRSLHLLPIGMVYCPQLAEQYFTRASRPCKFHSEVKALHFIGREKPWKWPYSRDEARALTEEDCLYKYPMQLWWQFKYSLGDLLSQ